MKKKRQKLIAVQVAAAAGAAGAETIVPLEGGTLEDLLAAWRVVQIQPLGPLPAAAGEGARYLALLLVEESGAEEATGRLGFSAT